MSNFNKRVTEIIANLKYEIKSTKDIKTKKELQENLTKLENLYNILNTSSNKEESLRAKKELSKYLNTPTFLNLVTKLKRELACLSLIAAASPLMCACGKKESSNIKEEKIIEETMPVKKTYTLTIKDYSGKIINRINIPENTLIKEPNNPKREGYEFSGWYNNNEEYNFDTPITSNLTLEARWTPLKYETKEEVLTALKSLIVEENLDVNLLDNSAWCKTVSDLLTISDIISANVELLDNYYANIDEIKLSDYELLPKLPRNIYYGFLYLSDNFESVSLKDNLKGCYVGYLCITENGNVNSSDLERFLNASGINLDISSTAFDKYELLDSLCHAPNPGKINITLNEKASNKSIILPEFTYCSIFNTQSAKNTKVICNTTEFLNLKYEEIDTLDITCSDTTKVSILGLDYYDEMPSYETIFSNSIFQKIKNVEVFCVWFFGRESIYGKKCEDGHLILDENLNKLGLLTENGFQKNSNLSKKLEP